MLGPPATATKIPFPYVTEFQDAEDGRVLAVQVTPSGELAAAVPPEATATKIPFPYATDVHVDALGSVFEVQDDPSEEQVIATEVTLADAVPLELVNVQFLAVA